MPVKNERREIPYEEYRIIARLLQAHVDQYGDRLKAMIAFGDLLTQWDAFDIDLLEVIQGWEGKRFGEFSSAAEPALRGKLRLYLLTPEEIESPALIQEPEERKWVEQLLERVRQGYEIITESSQGWTQRVLERARFASTFAAPPSGSVEFADPYKLSAKDH
jgi:hypothetical protein